MSLTHKMSALSRGPALLALFILMAALSWGQVYSGSMTGVITDPSGAVVPNVNVTVTDTAKGFTYRATTDSSGRYLVRPLPPSSYRLNATAAGFKEFVQDAIQVAVNQNAALDVRLELGTGSQSVEVSATAGALATQDAVTGQELTRNFVNDLPLLGRGVFDLAGLTSGLTQTSGGFSFANYANNFISNGSRNATSDILVDGVSTTNNEQATGVQVPLLEPSVDSVQEFKVQQSNFSSDIGFTGSTVINVVSRSGSNQLHGSAYYFLRNNKLTANDWYANSLNTPLAGRRYNDFGGTLAGPIKKDKTLYFFDIEGRKNVDARTFRAGVPSAAMRKGDFSEICPQGFNAAGICNNPNGQLWDPYSGTFVPTLGVPIRSVPIPFNNMATFMSAGSPVLAAVGRNLPAKPGNLIDPVAMKMMQYYPQPNVNVGNPNYNRLDNWLGTGSNLFTAHQWGIKIDHSFSEKARTAFKFVRQAGDFSFTNPFGNALNPSFSGPVDVRNHMVSINHNQSLGSKTLLNVTFGLARNYQNRHDISESFDFDAVSQLGLPEYMRRSGIKTSPAIVISDYASIEGVSVGSLPYALLRQGSETWDLSPSISRVQGKHDIKAGVQTRLHRINFMQPGAPGGAYGYWITATSQYYVQGGGDSFASFLTGIGAGGGSYDIPAWVSTHNYGISSYVQDNWRVNDRLTLNLGLRYEVETPRTERYDRQSWIDLNMASPLKVPGMPNLKGGMMFAGGDDRSPYGWDRNNFGPRVGFAYKVANKVVLRGGYGLFFVPSLRGAAGTGAGSTLGFSRSTTWVISYDGQTPWARLNDPYPITGPNLPVGASGGAMSFVGEGISGPERSLLNATPYEQSWSFGFQREIPGGIVLDANYIGKKGTKLYYNGSGRYNTFGRQIESYTAAQLADLNTYVANPFYGYVPANTPLGGQTVQKYRLQMPYPQFTGVSSPPLPVANSIYNSLQLRAEKRLSHGLQFLVTYTYQRSVDDSSAGSVTWMGGSGSLQNPNDRAAERSVSQFDIPHVFGFNYVYDLPFGHKKAFGANWNGVTNAIFGGWKTNGIWRFSTGQPLALYFNGSTPLPTYGTQRPNLTADLTRNEGSNWRDQYFANPTAAVRPAPYTLGNAPRTLESIRTPGVNNANLSIFKAFEMNWLREGAYMEFRAEGFNAFNHPQFCGPNTTIDGGQFGSVTRTCNLPREVQLALKLYW